MSTAVAAPSAAPMSGHDRNPSPRNYPALAPSNAQSIERHETGPVEGQSSHTPAERSPSDGKKSPRPMRGLANPKVIVKKEPGSPSAQNPRHRPRKLDLASNSNHHRPTGNTPLTGREGLVMQDVGLACLSPGFQTQDPTMREQLQRSISVRDQQRSIIEARLLKSAKGEKPDTSMDNVLGKPSLPNSKKRPPPGLSIVPPPAERFANERVIQSAPLNQTFTGRNQPHPAINAVERQTPTYHQQQQPQHIQHMPAVQTSNRLPPISDVFGAETMQHSMHVRPPFHHTNSNPSNGPPLPSPGFPPQTAHPMSQSERPREYRSAEDAVHELTGGREDLQPKIVRYGGRQPPTPPSPNPKNDGLMAHKYNLVPHPSMVNRRRSRHEYEGDSSPPLGHGREQGPRTGPFGEGRDSPATQKAKKEEFLQICSRAWDLFHS